MNNSVKGKRGLSNSFKLPDSEPKSIRSKSVHFE